MQPLNAFLADETAATAVEYAVMLAAIIMTALAAITAFGLATNDMYGEIDGQMEAHNIK